MVKFNRAEQREYTFCKEQNITLTQRFILSEKANNLYQKDRCAFHGRVFYFQRVYYMETRVALIGIILENHDSVEQLNRLLFEYGEYIIGRMGLPYPEKNISIISVAIDAPQDTISALSGKIGRLSGVAVKTAYSSVGTK